MAYFPNSCAGEVLDMQCAECQVADDAMCPVLYVQMTYNYEQFSDDGKPTLLTEVMNHLIDEHGVCQMKQIIDTRLVDKKQGKLF